MRRNKIVGFAFIALCFVNISLIQAQSEKPNFIVIFPDDLGYGDLSCYGHPTIHTPNLDLMASEGMRFTQFYVGAAVCSPSRAALLTGRLPIRTGVYGTRDSTGNTGVVFLQNSAGGLPLSELTIAELLKSNGYTTGIIGKWHLGHMPQYLPLNQGFDYWFGIDHHQNGPEKVASIAKDFNMHEKDDVNTGRRPWCSMYRNDTVIEENPDMRFYTRRFTEEAIDFITRNNDNPFFLYLTDNNPHTPLKVSPEFAGVSKRGLYGDVVVELDWSVGEILKALKDLDLDENTLVLFASDNGPWLPRRQNGGSSGLLRDGKNSAWEGGFRVPAIAWWPGRIKANVMSTELASTLDILPTFASLSGAELPDDRVLDGVDISGLLLNEEKNVRDVVYYYINQNLYAIRKGPWKGHFVTHDSYTPELPVTHETPLLYNLDVDPSEKYNVAERHPGIIEELRREFEKHRKIVPAPPEIDREL